MARVLALIPDLLFGSRVQSELVAGGHEIELVGSPRRVRRRLSEADVLLVDLTDERIGGLELVEELVASSAGGDALWQTLGFYSHVDAAVRDRAQKAGFDLVVPRSRMAREGALLVSRLVARRRSA